MLRAEMKLTRAPRGIIETMVSNVGVGESVHQFRDKVPFVWKPLSTLPPSETDTDGELIQYPKRQLRRRLLNPTVCCLL